MIREARPDDLAVLEAIRDASLAEPWPDLLDVAVGDPLCALVATADGVESRTVADRKSAGREPVGYAVAVPGDGETYLAELAVSPDRRGRGHGSALLDAVLDRARSAGKDRVWVTVRADDERVRAFYRQHGFERTDRLPDHYQDGDGCLLVRRL